MAASSRFVLLLLSACIFQGVAGLGWAPQSVQQGKVLYACEGSDLVMDWHVSRLAGDKVIDTEWSYDGRSQEVLAFWSRGHLIVTPGYAGRVTRQGDAGLVLHNVTSLEAGNYSVDVSGVGPNGLAISLRSTVTVIVKDHLLTTDGLLHAEQRGVIFDRTSGQFRLQLACGTFIHHESPPFDLEWITPSGVENGSWKYEDGLFLFVLDNVVVPGDYACRLPAAAYPVACQAASGPRPQANVTVDAMEARLAMLEAGVHTLQGEVSTLENQNEQLQGYLAGNVSHLEAANGQLAANLTHLEHENAELARNVTHLEAENLQLQHQLDHDVKRS